MTPWRWAAIAGGLTFAGEIIFGRRYGILIGVIVAIAVLFFQRYRYYRFHRCMHCARIIWPWQTWIYASLSPGQHGHYHGPDCFSESMREHGYVGGPQK
jgi:hypothetical protein